jgi:hypothetical protein
MSIFSYFGNKAKSLTSSGSSDSVFLKTAAADTQVAVAKARIAAVDTLNKLKQEVASSLDKEVERVHAEADKVKDRLEGILAKL